MYASCEYLRLRLCAQNPTQWAARVHAATGDRYDEGRGKLYGQFLYITLTGPPSLGMKEVKYFEISDSVWTKDEGRDNCHN